VIGRAEVMDAIGPGGLGGTYAGSPVAVAAALAVLDVIENEDLNNRANAIGARIRAAVEAVAARNDTVEITGLRGPGAMIAFDVRDPAGVPDGTTAKRIAAAALERGLVLLTCGTRGQTIRILVPLTVSDAILDEGLAIMTDALACVA
jgi:4-aminobutyrate aminotransferase/(S)-3-amino-2-methylpropionate transaminase